MNKYSDVENYVVILYMRGTWIAGGTRETSM